MRASISIQGNKQITAKFERMAMSARKTRPAFNKAADYLMAATAKQFSSQGRRGGGSWKGLTHEWTIEKAALGGDPRILHFRGPLRRSVTKRRTKGQVLIITQNRMVFGTSIEYGAAHQFGYPPRNIPRRPFLKVLPGDRTAMRNILRDHLMSAWTGKGGGVSGRSR
jgi:phage gpG-like protein